MTGANHKVEVASKDPSAPEVHLRVDEDSKIEVESKAPSAPEVQLRVEEAPGAASEANSMTEVEGEVASGANSKVEVASKAPPAPKVQLRVDEAPGAASEADSRVEGAPEADSEADSRIEVASKTPSLSDDHHRVEGVPETNPKDGVASNDPTATAVVLGPYQVHKVMFTEAQQGGDTTPSHTSNARKKKKIQKEKYYCQSKGQK